MSSTFTDPASGGRERLIEAHLPLVRAVARRHTGRGEALDDLVQVGAIGLIKAADRFDPSRGVAFTTFATHLVEGEIRRHLRDRTSPLRIPRELQRMSGKVRRSRAELQARLGRSPTIPELASALATDERDVERALGAERARGSIAASTGDAAAELADQMEPLAGSENRVLLERSVHVLDERERRIVFLRFHADMTERQIAHEVGISQAHVSRLLHGALAKLRDELATAGRPDITADGVISPRSTARSSINPGNSRGKAPQDTRIAAVGEAQENREIPKPSRDATRSKAGSGHSGRLLVRMPSTLHEQLALAAQREHVSLNRLVTDALAASVGSSPPVETSEDSRDEPAVTIEPPRPQGGSPRAFRVALATNLAVVVVAGLIALALLVLALERGI